MTNWKTTGWLTVFAAGLFAFIYFIERHSKPTSANAAPAAALLSVRPAEITNIVVRRTNQFVLRAERVNQQWNLALPIAYPAQNFAIEKLLQTLNGLTSYTYLSKQDMAAQERTLANFGLDMPAVTLVLQHHGRRTELLFGSKTPVGDQVYLQLLNAPGVYVVNADILPLLPRTANDWRDTALLDLKDLVLDRIEVRNAARTFAIEVNPTNKTFYLSKPSFARASSPKVEALLLKLQTANVQFVTDDPLADLDLYGLRPPAAELIFGQGTNDLVTIQFGKSPTNDPALVYARRMSQTNVVLVPRAVFDALQTSHSELRDRRLLSFAPEAVDAIDVTGDAGFSVRRQTNGLWSVTDPQALPADSDLIREWLNQLSFLEGNVEKDVVTDFAPYGLKQPLRQHLLSGTSTNADGTITNRVLTKLAIGTHKENQVFARGDDDAVYSLSATMVNRLPSAPWQLRERRVWAFSTNQVSKVAVRHRGYTREFLRAPTGDWSLAPGTQGMINTFALEEILYRLGELRAVSWVARGDESRSQYGFSDAAYKLSIELRSPDKPRTLQVELSTRPPAGYPLALATIDGQTWIFEFNPELFSQIIYHLSNPPLSSAPAGG
jgi:hypothetical protein